MCSALVEAEAEDSVKVEAEVVGTLQQAYLCRQKKPIIPSLLVVVERELVETVQLQVQEEQLPLLMYR